MPDIDKDIENFLHSEYKYEEKLKVEIWKGREGGEGRVLYTVEGT